VVYGDSKRIRQICTNILNNAYKYTPSGWINFNVYVAGDGIFAFDILDTGIGIKEEDLPCLFDEFIQLDVIRNKNISGTGLGLAITKRLCELMDGEIHVRSVYGKGSAFEITLPLRTGTEADLPHQEAKCEKFTASGARILLVDDVEINLEIAAYLLMPYGVICTLSADGLDAVQKVSEDSYDLILMDHMMPKMDGIEATKRIRAMAPPMSKTPIVALTANAISGNEEMFLAAGFNAFLSKPIDENALAQTLLKFLPARLIVRD
jgi:CheY-like chemotaxis protein